MNPLQTRLAALRRRLRTVATLRGGCLALAALVGSVALACLIDQAVHVRWGGELPALVRAAFLVAIVGGTGYVAYRFLLRPLAAPADDLALALKVEEHYPVLNDALASTVQFLQQSDEGTAVPGASPVLKREAVQRAMRLAQGCDFNQVIDGRGSRVALACLAGGAALAAALLLWRPDLTPSALVRVADPFGGHLWPGQGQQTFVEEVSFPPRIAARQPFTIRARIRGVIPAEAYLEFQNFGDSKTLAVGLKDQGGVALFARPLDMSEQQRDFRFRIRANDGVSPKDGWHVVQVRYPPSLAPLNPRLEVSYPRYTGLPSPHRPPAGSGNIEGVDGTHVRIHGATDRKVAHVWVEHRPQLAARAELDVRGEAEDFRSGAEKPVFGTRDAAALGVFGPRNILDTAALAAGGHSVWGRTYGTVDPSGREFHIDFTPRVRGAYRLYIQDEDGLAQFYEYDLQLRADPPPEVTFVQPAANMNVAADAEITLRTRAEDDVYAVRDVYLEYRRKGPDGKFLDAAPRRLELHDPAAFNRVLPQLLSTLATTSLPHAAAPLPPLDLRPTRVDTRRRWSLAGLVKEGDVVAIQACARDWNDVAAFPATGRSRVIELRVVSRPAVVAGLDDAQAELELELLRLREMQEKAIKKVIAAEEQWRATGKIRPEDVRDLAEAEATQKAIQARIGVKADEGMRGELRRMEQMMKDNKLPPSATAERLKAMKEELDRLAREQLPEIEPRLAAARRDLENPAEPKAPPPRAKGDLPRAREHQEEVKRSLDDLLRFLENWADVQQVRGELRQRLQDQRDLQKETLELERNTRERPEGQPPAPQDDAKARELASRQNRLAEDTQKLVEKMKRLAEEKAIQDPKAAEMLQKAAKLAEDWEKGGEAVVQEMRDTAKQLHDPSGEIKRAVSRAADQQAETVKTLEKMLEALAEGRDDDLERLVKKQKDGQKQLGEIGEKLEKLRKKAAAAQNIADPKEREAEMKKLAEEQRQLQEEAEKRARELQRLQAPQAGKALDQAGEKMEGAAKKLDRGEDPDEDIEQAQQKLKEAQQKLEQAQERTEEELAREQMARIADRIKGLKERQDAAIAETERLHKAMLQQSRWSKALRESLIDHIGAQELLGKETDSLTEKLKGALVFEHMLKKTVQSMQEAAKSISKRKDAVLLQPPVEPLEKAQLAAEETAQALTLRLQRDASKRLERMMEAIKPEPGVAQKPPPKKDNNPPKQKEGEKPPPKEAQRPPGDNVPPLAQLKALRAEQQDVNQRTRDFAERHPDAANLPPDAQAELGSLREDQERLSELFRQMQRAAAGEGGNP